MTKPQNSRKLAKIKNAGFWAFEGVIFVQLNYFWSLSDETQHNKKHYVSLRCTLINQHMVNIMYSL